MDKRLQRVDDFMKKRFAEKVKLLETSALAGRENVLKVYEEAVKERYRFFSFGDACFFGELK